MSIIIGLLAATILNGGVVAAAYIVDKINK